METLDKSHVFNVLFSFFFSFFLFSEMKREAGDGPQGGGPQKRYRGGDGNEIRLLIPSKVCITLFRTETCKHRDNLNLAESALGLRAPILFTECVGRSFRCV